MRKNILDKVVNFKDFSRPTKEIKDFSRTLTEVKDWTNHAVGNNNQASLDKGMGEGDSVLTILLPI